MTPKERLDQIMAPVQAEYDNEQPMMPGTIDEIKSQVLDLFDELIGEMEPDVVTDLGQGIKAYDRHVVGRNQLRAELRNKLEEK